MDIIQDHWVSGFRPSSGILNTKKRTTFRKLDVFQPSDEGETLTLLRSLERANLNHWVQWFKSTLSKGPIRVRVAITWKQKQIQFSS
jgi:hypothetical protein